MGYQRFLFLTFLFLLLDTMKTLYRIACRSRQGQVTQTDQLLDRVTVARVVRELNERCSEREIEYFAEAIDLVTLPYWLLTDLFQRNRLTYEELLELVGPKLAEQAMVLKQDIATRGAAPCIRYR